MFLILKTHIWGLPFPLLQLKVWDYFFGIDSSLQCKSICKYQKLGMVTWFIPVCYYDFRPSSRRHSLLMWNAIETTQQPFYGPLSGTTRVSQHQKKHSPTHHPDHRPIFVSFFHLPRSVASSFFKLRAWQSFCTTCFHAIESEPPFYVFNYEFVIPFLALSICACRLMCVSYMLLEVCPLAACCILCFIG